MLPENSRLIFKGIVGSQSYGLATETSDTDYKSIYMQSDEDLLSNRYTPQIEINKDDVCYELRRFLELVSVGNPNVLELLYLPEECVLFSSPEFEYIKSLRQEFLSKDCYNTFSGYARTQLRKAQGLNKKFNWEDNRIERKTIADFCKIVDRKDGKSYPLTEWLKYKEWDQSQLGLVKLDGFRDTYKVYHDALQYLKDTDNQRFETVKTRKYKGVQGENSNEPCLSEIALYMMDSWEGVLYWNREFYSTHCSDYLEYQKWLLNRNENRVITNKTHGQMYDGKNIMHTVRLILTGEEIATQGRINVNREKERDFLLSIKQGKIDLKQVIEDWTIKADELKNLYDQSDLKETVDIEFIKDLELKIRKHEL